MSSLHQYLTDDISDESYTWDDSDAHARDMAQSEIFRHRAVDDAEDITLDLELQQRLDFNATLLAIADARRIQRECEAMWQQHEASPDD